MPRLCLTPPNLLAVFDDAPPSGTVAAVYEGPESSTRRPSAAFTDTPADPGAGKTWKRSLKGVLRNFTVYGNGEQTTSATMTAGVSAGRAAPAPVATPAATGAEGSAARADTVASARPGVGSRLSHGALAASETSRNVR